MKKLFLFVINATFLCNCLFAQVVTPTTSFSLNVDYAKFRNDDKSGYLEIYNGFYPQQLTYQNINGKYHACVQLLTRMKNKNTNEFVVDEKSFLPMTVNDTSGTSFRYPFITQSGYKIPFGEYSLKVVAIDSLNPSRLDSISFNLDFNKYPDNLVCSDLELCREMKSSQQKDDPFYKNSLEVIPNPTLIFGITAYPVVFHYLELYNVNPGKTYKVKSSILDLNDKIVRESSKSRKYNVENVIEMGTTNVTSITTGEYRYQVQISDQNSNELLNVKKTFFIYNPHLQKTVSPILSFTANELADLSDKELSQEFTQARYIATDDEIKLFQQLNSEIGKREFLAQFWTKVIEGRLNFLPIARDEYLKHVKVANERYRTFSKNGWQTDRGRVYLIYGEPNDIERFPSVSESKPYEIWHYHDIENGVEFVFIDQLGFGNYRLVHSSKRGELWDSNWRNLLR